MTILDKAKFYTMFSKGDSQARIKALAVAEFKSKLVME